METDGISGHLFLKLRSFVLVAALVLILRQRIPSINIVEGFYLLHASLSVVNALCVSFKFREDDSASKGRVCLVLAKVLLQFKSYSETVKSFQPLFLPLI